MKIKKFQAKNFAGALKMVKDELSEDAIILSTEEKKGFRPFVEVTAAVDYDMSQSIVSYRREHQATPYSQHEKAKETQTILPEKDKEQTTVPSGVKYLFTKMADDIKMEIENIRDSIVDMKNIGYEISLPPKKRMMMQFLRERAVREEFAMLLCEQAKDIKEIPSLIVSNIKIKKNSNGNKAIMLIGPTGVGKTTTMAKLSANALKEGKKVAMVNLDNYRIGSIEQVRIYSRIMGIPLSNVANIKELRSAISRYAETRDVIFIDTTGRNPKDKSYIDNLSEICLSGIPIELHLLMSATYDEELMIEMHRFYRKLPINYIAFTKVDEAIRFGSIYNLLFTYQKPVAYITTGQTVPDDFEYATADRITNLILKKEHYQ